MRSPCLWISVAMVLVVQVAMTTTDDGVKVEIDDDNLILTDEPEMEEDDEGLDRTYQPKLHAHPESVNWRKTGHMPEAIGQGACTICGYVSGTQALEARAAIATENYQHWSIQNILNCVNTKKICAGAQPMRVRSLLQKNPGWLMEDSYNPLVKGKCMPDNCTCYDDHNSAGHAALRVKQWFFLGPTLEAQTPELAEEALQEGPLTTCFLRKWGREVGNQCTYGCLHANSIIGYDKDRWYLQESWGANFAYPRPGQHKNGEPQTMDGTWWVDRGTECEGAILKKARYPKVFYDYDQGNAYFIEEGPSDASSGKKNSLKYVDRSQFSQISDEDYSNLGMAKRRCSLMATNCKGVLKLADKVELVKDIDPSVIDPTTMTFYRKVQMVVYLRHDATSRYLSIKMSRGKPRLVMTKKRSRAAPFFTSINRIISYDHPEYTIGQGELEEHDINNPDWKQYWSFKNANLRNIATGISLDVDANNYPMGSTHDPASPSQRFDIGISGKWTLKKSSDGAALMSKLEKKAQFTIKPTKWHEMVYMRWQARQVLSEVGKPLTGDWSWSSGFFDITEKQNQVEVVGGHLTQAIMKGNLVYDGKKLSVESGPSDNGRWSLEYSDL